jgi:acetyl esterase/lipase
MPGKPIDTVVRMLRERFSVPAKTIAAVRELFEQLANDLPPAAASTHFEDVAAGGVPGVWVRAELASSDDVILFLHGGGYNCGSTKVYRDFMARLSHACGARVLGIDYRLAPEHKFPAAVDDAIAAYEWLIEATPAGRVTFVGDSAGGGLVLGTLVALRDRGVTLPRGAICISSWTDLEGLGESITTKADVDPWIRPERIPFSTRLYVTPENVRHPYAAPLYADPTGLPPLLIMVGSDETLLDDSTRFAAKAEAAGVDVTLEVWDGMIHVWPFFAGVLPEGMQAFERMGQFVRETRAVSAQL